MNRLSLFCQFHINGFKDDSPTITIACPLGTANVRSNVGVGVLSIYTKKTPNYSELLSSTAALTVQSILLLNYCYIYTFTNIDWLSQSTAIESNFFILCKWYVTHYLYSHFELALFYLCRPT